MIERLPKQKKNSLGKKKKENGQKDQEVEEKKGRQSTFEITDGPGCVVGGRERERDIGMAYGSDP